MALHFAAFHVVGADVVQDALYATGRPVDSDDGNAGGDRVGEDRRQRVDVARRDEDGVDLLGDRTLDVSCLFRRSVLAVEGEKRDVAELLGFAHIPNVHVHVPGHSDVGQRTGDDERLVGGEC